MISVIFPHANNPENNRVLELNLEMLATNTTCPYEVLYMSNDFRPDLVYKFWDWGIRNAKYDLILWHNTDILMAPGWNELPIKYKDDYDWIGIKLVECGQIGVHPNNIPMSFGIKADTFERWSFEEWVSRISKAATAEVRSGFAWYSPSVWKKSWYIEMGGFDTYKSFPHAVDSEFRDKVEKRGCRFGVVNAFAYHLQRCGENLGDKKERV